MSDADRVRWDARWADGPRHTEASAFLRAALGALPVEGRALDLAAGCGRHALALARHGLTATAADVSPVGLAHAARLAAAEGLTLTTVPLDTDAVDAGRAGLPACPWDVIVAHHYLWRGLPERAAEALAPGGWLLYCHPTRRNLERQPKPSARWLLDEGELAALVEAVPALEVVQLEEGWADDRHEARLIARRRSACRARSGP